MDTPRPNSNGSFTTSAEQEAVWQRQLYESRKLFVACVERAIAISSPTRRRALYEEWRTQFGDDSARSKAKFAEACLAGAVKIEGIRSMVKAYEDQQKTSNLL